MGKKDLQLLPIPWLRPSHAEESCVDGDTALRPLRQSHLERQWVFGRPTSKAGSEFDTSCVCNGKICVVLGKGIWKSVMALGAPTGLCPGLSLWWPKEEVTALSEGRAMGLWSGGLVHVSVGRKLCISMY